MQNRHIKFISKLSFLAVILCIGILAPMQVAAAGEQNYLITVTGHKMGNFNDWDDPGDAAEYQIETRCREKYNWPFSGYHWVVWQNSAQWQKIGSDGTPWGASTVDENNDPMSYELKEVINYCDDDPSGVDVQVQLVEKDGAPEQNVVGVISYEFTGTGTFYAQRTGGGEGSSSNYFKVKIVVDP